MKKRFEKEKNVVLQVTALCAPSKIYLALVLVIALFSVSYLYFLLYSVYSTALRQDYLQRESKISSELAELEKERLAMQEEILKNENLPLEFKSAKVSAYLTRVVYLGSAK